MFREDRDRDGILDLVDEDFNHNGVLDPGEDLDGDRTLDRGDEDRNHDRILNNRPRPLADDAIFQYFPDGTRAPIPASYPYFAFRPGVRVPLLDATSLDRLTPSVAGVRRAPDATWRLRFDVAGVDLADDLAGTQAIFDR